MVEELNEDLVEEMGALDVENAEFKEISDTLVSENNELVASYEVL